MPDRLYSVLAKIERAKEHIQDLKLAIDAFLESDPYRTIVYDDFKAGERLLKLQIVGEPPPRLLTILGDAIHCLRSSLDHLACQLVYAGDGKITDTTAFPISYGVKEFESTKNFVKIKGANDEAIELIKQIQPYKGGNGDFLWRLHRLDIVDKHRFLITTAARNWRIAITGIVNIGTFFPQQQAPRNLPPRGALKDGEVLLAVRHSDMMPGYKDPQFTFQIAFDEIFEGEPMVPQLEQLADLITRMIESFRPLLN